jgi:hypothetical protein
MKILFAGLYTIKKEYNDSAKPVINVDEVRFNGIGDDGHETFYISRVDTPRAWSEDKSTVFGFCKTARKQYDALVTASLLLAHKYLDGEIEISSDGSVGEWQDGVKLVNEKVGKLNGFWIELKENPDAEYPDSVTTAIFDVIFDSRVEV